MDLHALVRPSWPPMAHVERGWQALDLAERRDVARRIDDVMARHRWPDDVDRQALRHFFAFLAQVETIAIEIPLRFGPVAPERVRPLLRRQLVDEVFHSALFARIAHELALPDSQPGPPLAPAERLLGRIRSEEDLSVSATLLNLVAEGWIENLFEHALRWGIAPAVFEAVLADESRHVEEAGDYLEGFDPRGARDAVHALEAGLMELSADPTVGMSTYALAGDAGYRALSEDLWRGHRRRLAAVGLEPSEPWQEMERFAEGLRQMPDEAAGHTPEALADTPWRRAARRVWDTPRDPTMQGDFDVPVGHISKRLLTPVLVAAIGEAWAANPRLNRVLVNDRVYRLPQVNVGVRVLVADDELATVVITHADQRSVRDIGRMLVDGVKQLEAARRHRMEQGLEVAEPVDDRLVALAGARPESFAVALSNPGKFGMVRGAGSFSGAIAPSTDLSVGQRRRLPVWKGALFVPKWHVNVGSLQDHRLFDGKEAGTAMRGLAAALDRWAVKRILRRPDTLDEETAEVDYDRFVADTMPPSMRMMAVAGFGKWTPVVVGGSALAALAGVGGFLLYSHLAAATAAAAAAGGSGQQQQQQVTVVQGSLDEAGDFVADDEGPVLDPFLADGRPRCRAIKADGEQCGFAAKQGHRCGRHAEPDP